MTLQSIGENTGKIMLLQRAVTILAVLFLPRLSLCQEAEKPAQIAFLVGVSDYEQDGLRDFQFAERNVSDLKDELVKQGFKATVLLGSGRGAGRADLKNIQVQWAEFLKETSDLRKSDLVVIGFSGQGRQIDIRSNEKALEDELFCPVDSRVEDPETMWSLSRMLADLAEQSGSHSNLILMDTNRLIIGKIRHYMWDGIKVPKNVGMLFACSDGQEARAYDEFEHGIFTHFFLDGLRGKARNSKGLVTWGSLSEYVRTNVVQESRKRERMPQKPVLVSNLVGESPVVATLFRKVEVINGKGFFAANDPRVNGVKPFKDVTFAGDFSGFDFRNAQFENCRFDGCQFKLARFYGAKMVNCKLTDCDFRGADTRNLTLIDCTDNGKPGPFEVPKTEKIPLNE